MLLPCQYSQNNSFFYTESLKAFHVLHYSQKKIVRLLWLLCLRYGGNGGVGSEPRDRSLSQGWSEVFPSAPYFVEEEEIEIRLIHS